MKTFERKILLYSALSGTIFLMGLAILLLFPQSPFFWGLGIAIISISTALSATHFLAAWQLFYGSEIYWNHFGRRRMIYRFLVFPFFYSLAYFGLSAWIWHYHYGWKLLMFWLLIAIPNTFHNLGQDRGILTVLSHGTSREALVTIRNFLLFFCFPLLFFIRSRELYRNSIPSALFTGAIEPLLKVLGIVLVVGLLGVVIYGAIQIKKKSVAVYLASVADWCSYPVLRLFSVAHLGAFSPAATIRHSLVYLSLTRRVSLSESETGFQRSAWARVGYLTFLVGIPLGLGFAWAEVKIFAEIVRQNGQSPLSIWGPEFFLFTLHGVIALNHFDTEIYAWRFREPGIANRILPSIQSW